MRTQFNTLGALALFTGAFLGGCGSSSSNDTSDGGTHVGEDGVAPNSDSGATIHPDGGTTPDSGGTTDAQPPNDGGAPPMEAAPPAGYPAFPPTIGQVFYNKGPVLSTPRIITITWQSDTNASNYQAFDDAIGASPYWALLSEYGVGPATSTTADHIVVTGTPESAWTSSNQVDAWVQTELQGAPGNGWPTPDPQTVYIVYLPKTANLMDQGTSICNSGLGGYHTEIPGVTSFGGGAAYALIMSQCGTGDEGLIQATESASHELLESATDPYPGWEAAWTGFDVKSLAFEMLDLWQDELGDACEFTAESFFIDKAPLPDGVQRFWSNKSAAAGHNPCVPVPSGSYNSVTPLGMTTLGSVTSIDATGQVSSFQNTLGYHISPGMTANVNVGLYSDGPITWTVNAVEEDAFGNMTNYLTVNPPQFTGKNGDMYSMTIKVNSAPAAGNGNAILLSFESVAQYGSIRVQHVMPVVIGAY